MKRKGNPTPDRLATIREELTAVVAEAQRVAGLPPTLEEVEERVDRYFAELGAMWNRLIDSSTSCGRRLQAPRP